jgi:hypothetical protein
MSEIQCTWANEFGTRCSKNAIEEWTWTWSPTDKQCFCQEHTKQCKDIFLAEYEDPAEGESALLDCCKIVKL